MPFTVHNPTTPTLADFERLGQNARRGYRMTLLIFLVCAAPVALSYLSYYVWHPSGKPHYGVLIEPARPLPDALLDLKDQWLLISVSNSACPSECANHLYWQRQIRETLGAEKDRVDWVWLVADEKPINPAVTAALQNAQVRRVSQALIKGWLGDTSETGLYVVDPLGRLIMRFPDPINASTAPKIRQDLSRLLTASNSWDQPGRPKTKVK